MVVTIGYNFFRAITRLTGTNIRKPNGRKAANPGLKLTFSQEREQIADGYRSRKVLDREVQEVTVYEYARPHEWAVGHQHCHSSHIQMGLRIPIFARRGA